MILFLWGADTFRSREKLKEIIAGYKNVHKSGLNFRIFEGKNISFEDLANEFFQFSMLQEKKLFVLKNFFSNSKIKEGFLKNIERFKNSPDIILLYEEREIPKKDKLFTLLKKSGKFQEFRFLKGERLRKWVRRAAEKYRVEIELRALERLIEFAGEDSWRLFNEIQKLASYQKGGLIKLEHVELLVRPKIETNIFKTIDAISQKEKKKAIELLEDHLEKGDNPLYLFSMVNYQFRNLLLVKSLAEKKYSYYQMLQKSKLPPFVFKKAYQQAQGFSYRQLKKIYRKIFEADLNIKTGKIEAKTALHLVVVEA